MSPNSCSPSSPACTRLPGRGANQTISERAQKGDQISLLLFREPDPEPLVVEVDHIRQGGRPTIVEIRSACRQPAQDWSLKLADVGTISADHRAADVGHLEGLTYSTQHITACRAHDGEERHPRE